MNALLTFDHRSEISIKVITALSLIIGKNSRTNFGWAKQCSENFVKGDFQSPMNEPAMQGCQWQYIPQRSSTFTAWKTRDEFLYLFQEHATCIFTDFLNLL